MKRCRAKFMRVNTVVVLVALVIGNYSLSLKAAEAVKATSESNQWQNLMDAGGAAFRLGKFDEAENQFASAACNEQNTTANELHVATSLMRQADACCKEERFATADRLYRRALEIRERKLGMNHADVVEILLKQAWLEDRHRNYLVEEQIYRRLLDIEEKSSGPGSPKVAIAMKNIAHCLHERAYDLDPQPAEPRKNPTFVEAEDLLERALGICEKAEGKNSQTATQILDEQSHMYWMFRCFTKTEQCLRRSLAIRDTYMDSDDPSLEKNLRDLIGITSRQDKKEDAQWFKRVLSIWAKNPTAAQTPPNQTSQVITLNNRGVLCLNMGELKLAESYFVQALNIKPDYKLCAENLKIVRNNMKAKERN